MAKYHVKKDGTPGVCHAQEGNCPLGDSSQHFSSKEEAQDYADKINEGLAQSQNRSITNEQKDRFNKFLKEKNIDLGSGYFKIDPDNLEDERTPLYNEILKENGEEPIFNQDREYSRNAIKSMEVVRALKNRAKDNIHFKTECHVFDENYKHDLTGKIGAYVDITFEEALEYENFDGRINGLYLKDGPFNKNPGYEETVYIYEPLDDEDLMEDPEYTNKQGPHTILEDINHEFKAVDFSVDLYFNKSLDETLDEFAYNSSDGSDFYETVEYSNNILSDFNPDEYKEKDPIKDSEVAKFFYKNKRKFKWDDEDDDEDSWSASDFIEWKEYHGLMD